MPGPDLVERLAAIGGRGACTDAERRASTLLRDHLRANGRPARLEPAWVRPQWASAWALHAAIAVIASLVAVELPAVGLGLLVAALVSYVLDVSGRAHLLRLVFPRRATQVVVSEPVDPSPRRVRLVLAAAVDAPRIGAASRRPALMRGAPALLARCMALLAGLAGARLAGGEGQLLGAVQLVPTVILLIGVAALFDIALSEPSRGVDEARAVAAAVALAGELVERPLRRLDVEVVLAGAGDGPQLGMQAYVRARRKAWRAEDTVVLALLPTGGGGARFSTSEGQLFSLRLHPVLVGLARELGDARETRRTVSPALPARSARWPALAIAVDPDSLDFALELVARLDIHLIRGAAASVDR